VIQAVVVAAALVAVASAAARTQESTAPRRPILIELRVGKTEMLGDPGRTLVGPDDAIGLTGAVQLSSTVGAWVSADYRPSNSSVLYPGPGLSPAVSLYALTVGVSRRVGPALGRVRLRPIEIGLGAGATQMVAETRINQVTEPPPNAQPEAPYAAELLESRRWRPTGCVRLRLAVPLGRVARLSAAGALAASHAGDVRLWNGRWESTGGGTRYRASTQVWRYGTIVAVPLTLGLGAEF
jgi:hypothetical protein